MRVLEIPADVAIGGVERQADELADRAAATVKEAEALVLAILRGDLTPPSPPRRRDEAA